MNQSILSKQAKILGALIAAAAIFGAGYYYRQHGVSSEPRASIVTLPTATAAAARPMASLPDFSGIVASQGPAVVNISVSGTVKAGLPESMGTPKLDPGDPFYDFFRRFQPEIPENETPVRATGSGFIISQDGTILTNAHVVTDADEVTVKLTDKREFKARIVGVDKPTDVAVLKIDAKNLPTVRIGETENVSVGAWVVAIGSPFGFENSVTAGIVSAKSRALPDEGYVPFLQTDVAINPGNSGGPLFDMAGEVVGINSQIYSRSGGYQGLSFAIPIGVAMKVERQLVAHGQVSRGRLGVVIQPLDQALANSFGLGKPRGALVSEVEAGSPAQKAGLAAGDVITKFNGTPIERSEDLPPLVADVAPGALAKLEVWRSGKPRELDVRVAAVRDEQAKAGPEMASHLKLGMSVRPLTKEEQQQAGTAQGLIVGEVGRGPAGRAGIQPGDIILSVNGENVDSVEQLRRLVSKYQKTLALLVLRDGGRSFVPVPLD